MQFEHRAHIRAVKHLTHYNGERDPMTNMNSGYET
jgi:hypothetical protein